MNCDNCRWFNKNGFAPGFGDCALHREVHSSNHVCKNHEEYEPRPHGEWKPYKDHEFSGGGYIMCTKCKWKFSFGAYRILQDDNYCPHCGSDNRKRGDPDGNRKSNGNI